MKFVFQRDRTVSSLFGYTIFFPKGQPVHVPPEMYREVIAVGGTPEEELDLDAPKGPGPREPDNPAEREAAIFAAFEALVLRDKRGDFTAAGYPHPKVLAQLLGWSIQDKERDALWLKFQVGKRGE